MARHSHLLIVAAAALLAACATTAGPKKYGLSKDGTPGADAAESVPSAPAADVTEASLKTGGDFIRREDLKAVPFDYDSATLSDAALAILKANAAIIKADPTFEALITGHCDARGTTAYNLALGQKRAKGVRDYYIRLGVDGARTATISYGKESPLCSESNDECWSKNRRVETRIRAKTVAGRSAAAKAVIAGKATPPPASPKVEAKRAAAPAPAVDADPDTQPDTDPDAHPEADPDAAPAQ